MESGQFYWNSYSLQLLNEKYIIKQNVNTSYGLTMKYIYVYAKWDIEMNS